jgi:hypothetical protein
MARVYDRTLSAEVEASPINSNNASSISQQNNWVMKRKKAEGKMYFLPPAFFR